MNKKLLRNFVNLCFLFSAIVLILSKYMVYGGFVLIILGLKCGFNDIEKIKKRIEMLERKNKGEL